jgi:hypothetical protein
MNWAGIVKTRLSEVQHADADEILTEILEIDDVSTNDSTSSNKNVGVSHSLIEFFRNPSKFNRHEYGREYVVRSTQFAY